MTATTQAPAPPGTAWPLKVGGLDPSLTSFGIAVAEGPEAIELFRLRPRLRGHERLVYLLDAVDDYCAGCDVVAVEGAVLVAAGGGENRLALAGLHWLVRHRLWQMGVPYAVVSSATRAKWITGNGGASKDACLAETIHRFPGAGITSNDTADALALAAMTAAAYGQPLVKMPKERDALLHALRRDKEHKGQPVIAWPRIGGSN